MKEYIIPLAAAILSFSLFTTPCSAIKSVKSRNVTEAAASQYVRFIGRSLPADDGSVSFDWSGTTLLVRFSGTRLTMDAGTGGKSYYNMWTDDETGMNDEDARVLRIVSDTTVVLAERLKKGEHEIILQLRNEGEQGLATVRSFTTDGSFLPPAPAKSRFIEFIGDSYTCGYGTESNNPKDKFSIETENCNLTYAAYLSQVFDAEFSLVCHSGMGVVRNYNSKKFDTMPERYGRVFDEAGTEAWDFSSRIPDLVVIYLGSNDFSTGLQPTLKSWCRGYIGLLGKIRSAYGENVPILCVACDDDEMIGFYVKTAVERSGFSNVFRAEVSNSIFNPSEDIGASHHPNRFGHEKLAMALLPYVMTLTSWELF